MKYRRFEVVALDDDCTRWACQRETDYNVFETIGDFSDEGEANAECNRLNEEVDADNEALELELARAYGGAS